MKKTNILAQTVLSGALALPGAFANAQAQTPAGSVSAEAIHPFHVDISNTDLKDLRKRIQATRWPDKETVTDRSQGATRETGGTHGLLGQ